MTKTTKWINPFSNFIYVTILALFWYYTFYYFYPNLGIPLLPDYAWLWLLGVAWVCSLPLPNMSAHRRSIWYILTVIAGVVIGDLLFDDLITSILLVLGVTWFSSRKVVHEIGTKEIVTLFVNIIIFYGFVFLTSYFTHLEDEHFKQFIYFFISIFILTIVGAAANKLRFQDAVSDYQGVYKSWGYYLGWNIVALGALLLGSIGILLVFLAVYPLIRSIVLTIIYPVATWAFEVFLPWLLRKQQQIAEEIPVEETGLDISEENRLWEEISKIEMNPLASLFWDIVYYSLTIALIVFCVFKILQYIRRNKALTATAATSEKNDSIVIEESSPQKVSLFNKLFSWIYSSSDTENKLRREYRQLLKLLRAKGVWTRNSFTVQQLNQLHQDLESPSKVYERLRYGDQELSNEEMEQAIADIRKIMREWK